MKKKKTDSKCQNSSVFPVAYTFPKYCILGDGIFFGRSDIFGWKFTSRAGEPLGYYSYRSSSRRIQILPADWPAFSLWEGKYCLPLWTRLQTVVFFWERAQTQATRAVFERKNERSGEEGWGETLKILTHAQGRVRLASFETRITLKTLRVCLLDRNDFRVPLPSPGLGSPLQLIKAVGWRLGTSKASLPIKDLDTPGKELLDHI